MPDITYDVGRVSFVIKGAWNLATSYEKLDAVSYNGSLYIAKQDVPGGTAITNTTYWQLAAEKGDKGDTGGVDSVNGQQGDVWFPDSRQLISDGYTTDTAPFLMKGNGSDSDRFELAKKLGNTVAVNQLANPRNYSNGSTTDSLTYTRLRIRNTNNSSEYYDFGNIAATGFYSKIAVINFSADSCSIRHNGAQRDLPITTTGAVVAGRTYLFVANFNGVNPSATDGLVIADMAFIDLTLWFGSTDRIPSDLLSHPENWGRYYAGSLDYNAGTLESADGTVMRSIHHNIWDEKTELGRLDTSSGANVSASNQLRTQGYIEVIPATAYYLKSPSYVWVLFYDDAKNVISSGLPTGNYAYSNNARGIGGTDKDPTFTTPPNCSFIRFYMQTGYGTTYKKDITVSHSGEFGYDQNCPFQVLAEVDTGSEVLRSAGTVADEKTPDGTITRRVGVVDLGTLNWSYNSGSTRFDTGDISGSVAWANNVAANAIAGGYQTVSFNGLFSGVDKAVAFDGRLLRIRDTSFNGNATAFKAALSGVFLYYELATPTTEQGTAFDPLVVTVKNGVLSWTNTKGIPVGHESHYFENLRKRVEDRLPDPPSADGTYRLTCTISGGVKTYSWEA